MLPCGYLFYSYFPSLDRSSLFLSFAKFRYYDVVRLICRQIDYDNSRETIDCDRSLCFRLTLLLLVRFGFDPDVFLSELPSLSQGSQSQFTRVFSLPDGETGKSPFPFLLVS